LKADAIYARNGWPKVQLSDLEAEPQSPGMSGITAIVRLAFFVLALGAPAVLARTAPQGDSNTELAKKNSNAVTSLISVPIQFNYEARWDRRLAITLLFPT
jgi:hypothetical protein